MREIFEFVSMMGVLGLGYMMDTQVWVYEYKVNHFK